MTEPEPMHEIHAIQEIIYNEEKNMSNDEKLKALHKEAEEVLKKYNLFLPKQQSILLKKAA